jgi:histidyl-tRNA synthetase
MLAADTIEALGLKGKYVIKVNNRRIFDGLREVIGLGAKEYDGQWLTVMRAIDKLDRLGPNAVASLLTRGRRDESGDITPGAGLTDPKAILVMKFLGYENVQSSDPTEVGYRKVELPHEYRTNETWLTWLEEYANLGPAGIQGVKQLREIAGIVASCGYDETRIKIDPSVVRGLDYYTGFVFEADLTFDIEDEKGRPVQFGSVGGGGRYDDLVARFTGQKVPATGFSIGVSRLQAALTALGRAGPAAAGPVIVTVMEKDRIADYQKFVQALRSNGISAELYLGNPKKFGKQLEYADKRGSPCVVIQGSDEREKGEVMLKDLIEGAKAAAAIQDNKEWKESRPAQVSVKESDLVAEVRKILARHGL